VSLTTPITVTVPSCPLDGAVRRFVVERDRQDGHRLRERVDGGGGAAPQTGARRARAVVGDRAVPVVHEHGQHVLRIGHEKTSVGAEASSNRT
jgi:hypothetical protein